MNASLLLFERQTSPSKAKTYADKKRTEVLIEKAAEDDYLVREWRSWRQQEATAALAGPHGADLSELIAELKAATRWDAIKPDELLAPWQNADRHIRALAIRVVNAFIVSLREKAGLVPYDDPIPDFGGGL
jgi:hypothetical protein